MYISTHALQVPSTPHHTPHLPAQVLKAFKAGKMESPVSGWLLKKIGTVTADTTVDQVRVCFHAPAHNSRPDARSLLTLLTLTHP